MSTCVLFISLMQLKEAQFLNATPLSLSSVCLAAASTPAPVIVILPAASTPAPVIVILPLTRIYASL